MRIVYDVGVQSFYLPRTDGVDADDNEKVSQCKVHSNSGQATYVTC